MIHGTFGSPREFIPLEEYLADQGFVTRAIALPGHGPLRHQPLSELTAGDIIEHCYEEYLAFEKDCDEVYIVGQSLGGLCALVVASRKPKKLESVIALAAPYEYAYFVNYWEGLFRFSFPDISLGMFYAPESFANTDYPMFMPWWFPKLYQESLQLFEWLQESLPMVDIPVLLGHSPYDLIVPFEEMEKITAAINKPHLVTTHEFRNCGHQIFPYSRERDKAIALIHDFIREIQSFDMRAIS